MVNRVSPTPRLPSLGFDDRRSLEALMRALFQEFSEHAFRLNLMAPRDGSEGPLQLAAYTVATLPAAATYPAGLIYVSDETGGAVVAFSDGTNWRRMTDRAVVS